MGFFLSSAIPSVVLGKKRSVLIQFFVVMLLTVSALFVGDLLFSYGINVNSILGLVVFFKNPFFAILYLAAPYLVMIEIDLLRPTPKK